MHILLTGLNHRSAPISLRERLTIGEAGVGGAVQALASQAGLYEAVLLATCNRTELYGTTISLHGFQRMVHALSNVFHVEEALFRDHLYQLGDGAVVGHLYRVAAGLDSLVMGEPQILGQVRGAYECAHGVKTTGPRLSKLFLSAIETGKAVRSSTAIGASAVSVATIALQLGRRLLGELEQRNVLILGAGEMCETAAMLASERRPHQIVIVNRTAERSERLATLCGGVARPLTALAVELSEADLVLTATGSKEPLITEAMLIEATASRGERRLLVIDLGVPRDVEASASCLEHVFLYSIDDLQQIAEEHLRQRLADVPLAEDVVERARERYLSWLDTLAVVPTIVDLREHLEAIRLGEYESHLSKINGLDERGRQRIEQLTQAIVNKILHEPLVRLKQRSSDKTGVVLAEAVRYLFGLDDERESS